jgi:dihydropteroate synthase
MDLQCGRFQLTLSRPLIMGVINITPDSFSGGQQLAPSIGQSLELAAKFVTEGADLLDLGAESTRPGATEVPVEEEWRRLAPVLKELVLLKVPVSVDTRKPEIMQRALDIGVDMINDVEGFAKPDSRLAVHNYQCACVVMHMQGSPLTMQDRPEYRDVVNEVKNFFYDRVSDLTRLGVNPLRIVIDPGIGFGKTLEHNLSLLNRLNELGEFPKLVGLSRKSLIGQLTGRGVSNRLAGSLGGAMAAVQCGAQIIRTHDVNETVDALTVFKSIVQGRRENNE